MRELKADNSRIGSWPSPVSQMSKFPPLPMFPQPCHLSVSLLQYPCPLGPLSTLLEPFTYSLPLYPHATQHEQLWLTSGCLSGDGRCSLPSSHSRNAILATQRPFVVILAFISLMSVLGPLGHSLHSLVQPCLLALGWVPLRCFHVQLTSDSSGYHSCQVTIWRLPSLCCHPLITIRLPCPTIVAEVQCGEWHREAFGTCAHTAGSYVSVAGQLDYPHLSDSAATEYARMPLAHPNSSANLQRLWRATAPHCIMGIFHHVCSSAHYFIGIFTASPSSREVTSISD